MAVAEPNETNWMLLGRCALNLILSRHSHRHRFVIQCRSPSAATCCNCDSGAVSLPGGGDNARVPHQRPSSSLPCCDPFCPSRPWPARELPKRGTQHRPGISASDQGSKDALEQFSVAGRAAALAVVVRQSGNGVRCTRSFSLPAEVVGGTPDTACCWRAHARTFGAIRRHEASGKACMLKSIRGSPGVKLQ